MSYQPIVIGSGLVGYQFLRSTLERQQETFNSSVQIQRETEYFSENIGNISSAEELVSDRRLLSVALTSVGLQDDINNRFFIQKILEEGTSSPESLANRLSDERYKNLAEDFSFDLPVPNIVRSYFADDMIGRYQDQAFEVAVGQQDPAMRLALNFERGIGEIMSDEGSDDANWFKVMGTAPVRSVIETALNLPASFSQIDIDQQLGIFRDRTQSRFGVSEISELADPEIAEKVVRSYLVQNQARAIAETSSGSIALMLLRRN